MNTSIKLAALSALMVCAAAYAQDPGPPAQPEQTPPARPSDPMPPPSDESMPEHSTSPATQTSGSGEWQDFRTADANGDGYVSKNEAEANPVLIEIFTEADSDQNGSLSSGEYDAARRAHEGQNQDQESNPDRY